MSGLHHSGLNARQVRMLRAIDASGRDPTELAAALDVPVPFISRTSKRMIGLGLIGRRHSTTDHRRITLRRLPAGDVYLAKLDCLETATAADQVDANPADDDREAKDACLPS